MELSLSGFLLFLGVPALLGSSILRALGIGWRTDAWAYPGWVWTCGALAVAALEVVRLLAGLASPGFVVVGAVVLSAALRLGARRTPCAVDAHLAAGRTRWSARERWLSALVIALVLASAAHRALAASGSVIEANDEANFWALRAKLLFAAEGFGGLYARALAEAQLPNASYPLLNPLLQLWVFDCAGGVTHVANRFPLQLSTLALLLCTAGACRRASRPALAAALLLPLAASSSTGIALRQANADVLVALGAVVAADAWQRGRAAGGPAWSGLAALALAFTLGAKKEGMLLAVVSLVALAVCAWRADPGAFGRARAVVRTRAALWLVPPLAVVAGTALHNRWFATAGSHTIGARNLRGAWAQAADLPAVLASWVELALAHLYGIPIAFAVLALLLWPRRAGALAFVPLANALFLGVVTVAVVRNADYLLRTAGVRVLSQLLGLQLLWLAAVAPGLLAALPDLRTGARRSRGTSGP